MLIKKFKKIYSLGVMRVVSTLKHKLQSARHERSMRVRASRPNSYHTWDEIKPNEQFSCFFKQVKNRSFNHLRCLYDGQMDNAQLIAQADALERGCGEVFGRLFYRCAGSTWHTDVTLQEREKAVFDHRTMCLDIFIEPHPGYTRARDIKVPWELSRCANLFVLAKAFALTGSSKYSRVFANQLDDWWHHNPFLFGVNWACTMEVSIRAINCLGAWEMFKNDPSITSSFWERFICSLYDHMWYLEHRWEWYDSRTNNHYVSNLVGYAFLTVFFKDMPGSAHKIAWVFQELAKELGKQVGDDGFAYEGSTAYHRLVTELIYHGCALARMVDDPHASLLEKTYKKMVRALSWCFINRHEMVTIGDDDSGQIFVLGLPKKELLSVFDTPSGEKAAHFPSFGLSVVRTKRWHVTTRHHACDAMQPSGHFHADAMSVTVALDGQPIIIDPGSYVYTSSVAWRNYFRSMGVHNTFSIEGTEPLELNEDLFSLAIPSGNQSQESAYLKDGTIRLCTSHHWYAQLGLHAHRTVEINDNKASVVLMDWWQGSNCIEMVPTMTQWRFNLAIGLEVKHRSAYELEVVKNDVPLMKIDANIQINTMPVWVSPGYLNKQESLAVIAKEPTRLGRFVTFTLQIL